MNILYDHEIFAKQRYGGISRYFFEIITRIPILKGADVGLFMGVNNNGYDFEKFKSIFFSYRSIRFSNIDKAYIFLTALNNLLFKQFAKANAFSILHKTYYSSYGLSFNQPKIITIHDMTHEIYTSSFSAGDSTSMLKRKCAETADGIICVSNTTKKDLINIFNIPEEKICVVYHGNSLREKVTSDKIINEPYILYVGQRWGYKNFALLLSAYSLSEKLNRNFKLVCFGGGDFNYSEQVYISENNLSNKVKYVSGGDEKLSNLYHHASVLVYPSLYEGFGFPPLEAMYYGCPVVASEFSSIPEVVGNAGIYFNPHEIEDLLAQIELVLTDTNLKQALVSEGYKREKGFSWDDSARQTYDFYKRFS